jgi:pilus assembly protein FimV
MKKPTWRATALALATAAFFSGVSMDANALALGRVTVQSALGEPLRAEVDIAEITPDELASLKAKVASPEAFRAAGLEYSPALSGVDVSLRQRPDGRSYLQLTSSRPVNDPFIDLILETQWASGRIVRDYTMLFDPPQMRQGSATAAAPMAPVTPAARSTQDSARATPVPSRPMPAARPAPAPAAATATRSAAPEAAQAAGDKVTVQRGDSAGRIAAAHKPPNVSLDQMLVALLQANPQAFAGGNVNRLKAGAVLQLPTPEQAAQASDPEATRTIIAQSRDFNEFRRRLAEGVPAAPAAASQRQASGKVQTEVQEKNAAPATPDKLTLSKGAVQGKAAADRIAQQRQADDAAMRLAELNKNITDLNKLQSSTAAPAAAVAAASGSKAPAGPAVPVAPLQAPAASASAPAAAAPASAAVASASAPQAAASSVASIAAGASSPAAAASAPAIAAKPASAPAAKPTITKKPAPVALPVEEPSLLDDLLENPIMLAAGAAVVALLAGFGVYRLRQRKKSPQVDSSFLESRLQPDSFFGGSGGQRIDTAEGGATGSSMVYSPSQLDAAGDVDPVAEADVYLAYGRDLQAEEILKEALRVSPHRVAIHSKLLEIYAKRRDAKAFEVTATDAYGLTHGEGLEWEHICELGRELDPSNALYQPGGAPSGTAPLVAAGAAAAARARALESPATTSPDLDLDLDFSSGDEPGSGASTQSAAAHLHEAPEHDHVDLDFDGAEAAEPALNLPVTHEAAATPTATAREASAALDEPLSFELPTIEEPHPGSAHTAAAAGAATPEPAAHEDALSFDMDPEPIATPTPAAAAPAPAPAVADDKMIEFDLGALSLDLDSPAATKAEPAVHSLSGAEDSHSTQGLDEASSDPLATKFALAQEFSAIGDPDGARSLAEEVLAEASGDLKTRAQKFLAEIG